MTDRISFASEAILSLLQSLESAETVFLIN